MSLVQAVFELVTRPYGLQTMRALLFARLSVCVLKCHKDKSSARASRSLAAALR